MTTFSALAVSTGVSPKRGPREGAIIDTLLIHHMASTDGPGVTRMMLGPGGREVSANYTIWSDGTIHGVVPEEDRAWTSGAAGDGGKGAAWDRRSITVEIENERAGDATGWPISPAALQAAANLLADLRKRYKIVNVLGHRDLYQRFGASYPTFCPGPETVGRILTLSPSVSEPAPASAPKPDAPKPSKAPAFPLPDNYYFGPEDGPAESVSGKHANKYGTVEELRKMLWRWQQRMEDRGWKFPKYGSDGMYGDETREVVIAFQREKGLKVDGLIGPETYAAAWEEPVT